MRLPVVLFLLLAAGAAACSDGASDAAPADVPGEQVAEGLCRGAASAAAGDAAAAEQSFAAVHPELHVVADALQRVDRTAAAALLRAKQKVEGNLHRGAPAAELRRDLRRLASITRSGLERLGVTVDPCDL